MRFSFLKLVSTVSFPLSLRYLDTMGSVSGHHSPRHSSRPLDIKIQYGIPQRLLFVGLRRGGRAELGAGSVQQGAERGAPKRRLDTDPHTHLPKRERTPSRELLRSFREREREREHARARADRAFATHTPALPTSAFRIPRVEITFRSIGCQTLPQNRPRTSRRKCCFTTAPPSWAPSRSSR